MDVPRVLFVPTRHRHCSRRRGGSLTSIYKTWAAMNRAFCGALFKDSENLTNACLAYQAVARPIIPYDSPLRFSSERIRTHLLRSRCFSLFIGRLPPSNTMRGSTPCSLRRFTRFMQKATYLNKAKNERVAEDMLGWTRVRSVITGCFRWS